MILKCFFRDKTPKGGWLGLYKNFTENQENKPLSERKSGWRWMDGTEINYTLWRTGEPSGKSSENCARIENGFLLDAWRSNKLPFICKKALSTQTTSATTVGPEREGDYIIYIYSTCTCSSKQMMHVQIFSRFLVTRTFISTSF